MPPPPHGTQFFHFRIHFHQKVPMSEVHAPLTGARPPPTGNPGSATDKVLFFLISAQETDVETPCPDFSKYLYFLFAPTLVYRDSYPRYVSFLCLWSVVQIRIENCKHLKPTFLCIEIAGQRPSGGGTLRQTLHRSLPASCILILSSYDFVCQHSEASAKNI